MRNDVPDAPILARFERHLRYDEYGSMHRGMAARYDCGDFFETHIK